MTRSSFRRYPAYQDSFWNGWTCFAAVVLAILFYVFVIWLEMMLWNWVVADSFGGPRVTFWIMAGISLLVGLLFGGGRAASR